MYEEVMHVYNKSNPKITKVGLEACLQYVKSILQEKLVE